MVAFAPDWIALKHRGWHGDNALQVVAKGQTPSHGCQQARAIGEHPLGDLLTGLAHNDLFAIDEREHGVRRSFSGFDQSRC
jgi:hypothetical protein